MAFVVENMRLKELFLVAEQNKIFFDDFLDFLKVQGFSCLTDFVLLDNDLLAEKVFQNYLNRPLPDGIVLLDGIARPYKPEKAKWLFLGWLFRDAPEQRLRPILPSIAGETSKDKQAKLFNSIRKHVAQFINSPERWEWPAICEVITDRLEGSRRAIKGTLFEAVVRNCLENTFKKASLSLTVSLAEIKLDGETYDVKVDGQNGSILIPVKTRETMGGGHALLFTRDIHKSISVAHQSGYECIPVIIAESWSGDISSLNCQNYIYIDKNPNQINEVTKLLQNEVDLLTSVFSSII